MTVYAHVNTVPYGSTGGIMMKEHRELLAAGDGSYAFWGRGREAENVNEMKFCTGMEVKLDVLQTRLDGRAGFHSRKATTRLLRRLDEIGPEVVHLHNLHGYYINVEMLFTWLAVHDCHIEWTLHDCWAFTGHCTHFTYVKCAQWQSHCSCLKACPQLDAYPKTLSKMSCARNFEDKRRIFTMVPPERMALIAPSQWLADLVGKSFLKGYPIEVQYNTIDRTVFKPTPSDFRERYGIGERFMVLGVASPWTERKGLDDFVRLAGELDSDKFAIVLVGLSDKQIRRLSNKLVALPRVESQERLVEAYSAADVFVHPGVEETFGMTVVEAQACGTPVVVTEGSACAEVADPGMANVIPSNLSTLQATVLNLAEGVE